MRMQPSYMLLQGSHIAEQKILLVKHIEPTQRVCWLDKGRIYLARVARLKLLITN